MLVPWVLMPQRGSWVMQVFVKTQRSRVVVEINSCCSYVIGFQFKLIRRGLGSLVIKLTWMIGYCFIYSVLVSSSTHFIRIMVIDYMWSLLVSLLLYHVVYAFIVGIIRWKVLRFLIIRHDRFVHLFLKFIIGGRCVHLLLNWRKSSCHIGRGSCARLLLSSNALPMMWLSGDIRLGALIPMNIAYFSHFVSVRVLVVFH